MTPPLEARFYPRAATRLQATLHMQESIVEVELRDISEGGMETLDANAAQVIAANPVMPASETDGSPSCVSAVADSSNLPADEQINAAEEKETLRLALDALPPRLRQVLDLHYGEDLTLRDVGSILGVTESRASQLHHQALDKVRKAALHPMPPRASREIPLRFRESAMALQK